MRHGFGLGRTGFCCRTVISHEAFLACRCADGWSEDLATDWWRMSPQREQGAAEQRWDSRSNIFAAVEAMRRI
jgi:hypothetical protein